MQAAIDYSKAISGVKGHPSLSNKKKLELITELRHRQARTDFGAFRRLMHPKNKQGWFQQDMERQLQKFFDDYVEGLAPILILEAPPQHGKSVTIVDFIAWMMGRLTKEDFKAIYTSFSSRLGIRANLQIQRMMGSSKYQRVFPDAVLPGLSKKSDKTRNRDIVEYGPPETAGYFRNTTVGGSITGESLDLGVIDDPIRGRKDANSQTVRDSAWDWLTDDFLTRFSDGAALLAILTRWHVDDPIGRLIEKNPRAKVCKYPALADETAPELMAHDPRKPGGGEALFPEHKSRKFLEERKKVMARANWTALYQQSPYIQGGGIIKGDWFGRYDKVPPLSYRAMFGDTAIKAKEHNDYQCAAPFGLGKDGYLYILDMLHDKFEAHELEKRFPDFWRKHLNADSSRLRYFGIEDKASGSELVQRMKKKIRPAIPVKAIPRSTDKYTRVSDVLGYIEAGYIRLPEDAPWVHDFIAECEAFTADDAHAHDDMIDVLCDAISNMLHNGSTNLKDWM